jgi:hypothetical protein
MRIFPLWFKRATRYRHFALLDTQGMCRAFKSCAERPAGEHWVEVEHINLTWLGSTLPKRARIV